MKLTIKNTKNEDVGTVSLPQQFSEPVREDLIIRSVLSLQAGRRQPYGGYGDAGLRHSADLSKRRRKYRGSYGKGISRVPRKILSRRGSQMYMVGAIVAGTVGGRRAHGPKPFKIWEKKVNKLENRKAIRSALAATMRPELVAHRGHKIPESFPFILADEFTKLKRTREVEEALVRIGLAEEMERAAEKRIRAGKGKLRGRKYKRPTSTLFVTAEDGTPLHTASANLPGIDVVAVQRLNAELLAPGTHPGRLTLFTKSAIDRLANEGLFLKEYSGKTSDLKKSKLKKSEKQTTVKKTPGSAGGKEMTRATTTRPAATRRREEPEKKEPRAIEVTA